MQQRENLICRLAGLSATCRFSLRGRRNFTLVELLVVIAIIAILAALLMPVLDKARKAGQAASCQNNLKQQGVAFIAYADDYNGNYPVEAPLKPHLTCLPLSPYLGVKGEVTNEKYNPRLGYNGSKAFYCPSQNNLAGGSNVSDYGGWHKRWNSNKFETLKFFRVKQPSTCYLRLDSVYGWEPQYPHWRRTYCLPAFGSEQQPVLGRARRNVFREETDCGGALVEDDGYLLLKFKGLYQ